MRDVLALLDGQRLDVRATVLRISARIGWAGVREPTVLLGQVRTLDGALLTDHLWLRVGKRLAALDPHIGDVLGFSGRVAVYRKGLARLPGEPAHYSTDYTLAYPTRCTVLARASKPAPVAVPAADPSGQTVSTRTRIVNAVAALWHEQGEPPSLPALYAHAPTAPTTFLRHLHKLARAGTIAFQPTGHVFITTPMSTEGSSQP